MGFEPMTSTLSGCCSTWPNYETIFIMERVSLPISYIVTCILYESEPLFIGIMVVLVRFELTTPALSGQCSNQLSYKTILFIFVAKIVYICDKIEHVVRFELTIVRFCRPLPLTTRPHVQIPNMSMNKKKDPMIIESFFNFMILIF